LAETLDYPTRSRTIIGFGKTRSVAF
jgi:hypothetical protein